MIDGCRMTLSNLDKILWPAIGLTKGELIEYYLAVADFILPHLTDRPLVLTRFPDGVEEKCFFQKNLPSSAPDWLSSWPDHHSSRLVEYIVCHKRADLAWLGNQAAIELHPWHSRWMSPEYPDFAVIDLDPGNETGFDDAREVAFAFRELFRELELTCCPKTSGATGLHLYLPLIPQRHTYPQVVSFTRRCCEIMAKAYPERTAIARRVEDRQGKVYLDFLQNGRGKTLVSVYSARPLAAATVSCPVTWEELRHCRSDWFTVRTVPGRLRQIGDLFADSLAPAQDLALAAKKIGLDNF